MKKNKKPDRSLFDERELVVMDFAAHWHRHQKRKYTGEAYVNHLAAVAKTAKEYTGDSRIVAAAFCHDLYEDTACEEKELLALLAKAGYSAKEVQEINVMVWELTDEFIKEKYPQWNRKHRKTEEAKRLWTISGAAQSVKYADLIDNSMDLASNDAGFGRKYLEEMRQILKNMNQGNADLYKKALKTLDLAHDVIKAL